MRLLRFSDIIMAEVISLFDYPDFDYLYAGCKECGGDDFKLLLASGGDLGIIGFQCANIDCGVVAIFDDGIEDQNVIIFEIDRGE